MRGVGLVLLVASASLLTPAALAAQAEYQILFPERASTFLAEGVAGEGETRGYRFLVAQENVTRVEFVLTWRETGDPAGLSGPDSFSLVAQDPSGRPAGAPARASSGEARVEAGRVNPTPPSEPVDGDELAARLERARSTAGQGEWRAWVKLEDAGNPVGARVDGENAFRLVAIVHFYEGVPMRIVSFDAPEPGLAAAAADLPLPWALALGSLAALACALGVALALQARRRHGRTPAGALSPRGETGGPPGR